MAPSRTKRSHAEVEDGSPHELPRCKRPPPPSPDLYSIPAFAEPVAAAMPVDRRSDTPRASRKPTRSPLLTDVELHDVGTLLHHPPDSILGAAAVATFVKNGLARLHDGGAERPVALDYFGSVRKELARISGDEEVATTAHNAIVSGWQEKTVAWLGSSVSSTEQLAAVVRDVVSSSRNFGGLAVRPQLEQALYDIIVASAAGAEPTAPPMAADLEPSTARSEVLPSNGDRHSIEATKVEPDATQQAEPDEDTTVVEEARPPSPQPPLPEKFPNPESFFTYHFRMVTRKQRKRAGDAWDQPAKRAFKRDAKEEWSMLSRCMQAEWVDAHQALLGGDAFWEDAEGAAHLFHDGRPLRRQTSTSVKVDWSESAQSRVHTLPSAAPSQPSPTSDSRAPRPFKVRFKAMERADCKVYLSLYQRATMHEVTRAICAAAGGSKPDSVTEEFQQMGRGVFVISFPNVKVARRVAGTTVKIRDFSPTAWLYPATAPQSFAAQLESRGGEAVRLENIYTGIVSAFPQASFHLRREQDIATSRQAWLITFETPPGVLRFNCPVLRSNDLWKSAQFDPVLPGSACPVCTRGHTAAECDLLLPVSAVDLGISDADTRYLLENPQPKPVTPRKKRKILELLI